MYQTEILRNKSPSLMPHDGRFAEDSQDNISHKIGLVLLKLYHPLDKMPWGLRRLLCRTVSEKMTCWSCLYHNTHWRIRATDKQNKSEHPLFSHARRANWRRGIKTVQWSGRTCCWVAFFNRNSHSELACLRIVLLMGTWLGQWWL